ncbi:hypothetical protein [uncultured Roseibium sp.]|uniref:hypothetical protein n=1 Tax=uncultured Roseibium sp. TaxID=1936171 RepID=UPI002601F6D3|nr:hypothetical protein [uncultured Roseibium sp.]
MSALPQLRRDFEDYGNTQKAESRAYSELPETARMWLSTAHDQERRKSGTSRDQKLLNRRVFNTQNEHRLENKTPLDDLKPTQMVNEEQESGDQTEGRGSSMVGQFQPKANLRPPEHIARPVDRSSFRSAWMREQYEAAMAQAAPEQAGTTRDHNQSIEAGPRRSGPTTSI